MVTYKRAILSIFLLAASAFGQSVTVSCANMDLNPWTPVVGASISSVAASAYTSISEFDGVRFYAFGPAWAGVLFKSSCVLPPLPAKATITLSFRVLTDDAGFVLAQAQESDVMQVGPKGEVYNLSNQNNNAEGGHWQIVQNNSGKYQWADIGCNTGRYQADTWVAVSYTGLIDTVAQTASMQSVTIGGKTCLVPASMQNVPAQQLNWGNHNTAVVQFQQDVNGQGGAWSEKVQGVNVTAQW